MTQDLLECVKDLISEHTGLRVHDRDDETLAKLIYKRVRLLKLSGPEEYAQRLRTDGGSERAFLTGELTTGETFFFRDTGQFQLLRHTLLPDLIRHRQTVRRLRVWSAGCATGEEPYSLAMLLDEMAGELAAWDVVILGTDINGTAIERARRGRYGEWSFRATGEETRRRYFRREQEAWIMDERLRRQVRFRTCNLVTDPFPDRDAGLHDMDLILCRNVFIYLLPAVIARIAAKLTETLAEGGYLMTGHGEWTPDTRGCLQTEVFPESVVYRKAFADALPSLLLPPSPVVHAAPREPPAPAPPLPQPEKPQAAEPAPEDGRLAWHHADAGRSEQAARCCSEIIARNPFDAEPYYLLAQMAQERGDAEKAMQLLRQVIYLAPAHIAAYVELGDLYQSRQQGRQARAMRTTAANLLRALPPDAPVTPYAASTASEILRYVEQQLGTDSA